MSSNSLNSYYSAVDSDTLYDSPLNSDNSSDEKLYNDDLYKNLLYSNREVFDNYIFAFNIIKDNFELIHIKDFDLDRINKLNYLII